VRPDTEPNIHAKRIMAGAAALTAAAAVVHGVVWLAFHAPTVALGAFILSFVGVGCYALGVVALEMTPSINGKGSE